MENNKKELTFEKSDIRLFGKGPCVKFEREPKKKARCEECFFQKRSGYCMIHSSRELSYYLAHEGECAEFEEIY